MHIVDGPYEVSILNEPMFTPGSGDNVRSYKRQYVFEARGVSRHGIECCVQGKSLGSAVVVAGGGATGVHRASLAAFRRRCFVAVGDQVVCLELPDLELLWSVQADPATVFGVYAGPEQDCVIIHGELEISRFTLDGELQWSRGGADIFTEGFAIVDGCVEAIDFEGRRYRFALADGAESA